MDKEKREHEKIMYARTMFWGDKGSQDLICELLNKIYSLEDRVKELERRNERDFERESAETSHL